MRGLLRNSVFLWLFMLASCSCVSIEKPATTISPASIILPPASLGHSLSLSQRVVGEYGDKSYKMRFEVEVTSVRLTVIGLSPLGVTLFTLTQEQDGAPVVTGVHSGLPLDPKYLLFDLYLAYWPSAVLGPALERQSMQLESRADGLVRSVTRHDGKPIAEVVYRAKPSKHRGIIVKHFDTPYRLTITTLGR
jgi:hypothetical protein